MNKYTCRHCGKTMERDSKKQWVKSYCEMKGKTVHLVRIDAALKEMDDSDEL